MYKITGILLFLLSSVCFSSQAQSFEKGTKTANLGLGLGYGGLGVLGSVEVGLVDDVSVGLVGGITRRNYGYFGSNWGVNVIAVGGRASYHFNKILKEFDVVVDKLDPYVGVTVGFRGVSYDNGFSGYNGVNAGPFYGGYLGARYQLKNNLGVMVELGAPFSSAGVTFKF
ncbi:hypothetical protein [Lacihabitans soyangensis]|uniref:Outer membrane protein beta-barrel domain-containing protein n=1 Tax=Lacihabitans soyangensis TaxID=869394 RepID=A0AAE3KU24_9BACT|nr:hypothetical protein [Lacihabitans soyangensis]MCP9762771.1 hypothetical protein [Lacihabitans soyangensis]